MGKRLSAAQRKKIAESVSKSWAKRRAAAARPARAKVEFVPEFVSKPVAANEPISKFSVNGKEQLATDIVTLIVRDVDPNTVVQVVERILR